jgi:hypothetical protein
MDFHCQYDVAIAGAGIAGIAGAIAAARQGKKVALIEKQTLIGGLATSGIIFVYLPLCDGNNTQVTFGLAEEMLRRCTTYGPFDLPEKWGGIPNGKSVPDQRLASWFSPAGFVLELDKMLKEANVDLWLETLVTDVECDENNRITSILVSNMSGNGKITADCFVDSTGSAFLVRRAGGKIFSEDNFVTPWWIECNPTDHYYHFSDDIHIDTKGKWTEEFLIDNPLSGKSHTDFSRRAWQMIREEYDTAYAKDPEARRKFYPLALSAMPQFRKIGRIDALTVLSDNQYGTHFEDSVGLYADWRKANYVWETPYGSLVPKDVGNVLASGRCMGCAGDAWENYRVIPAAAMTGEISGVAAAMCAENNCDPAQLDVEMLKAQLAKLGFKFHLEEVGLKVRD